jgi:hypothetical protein
MSGRVEFIIPAETRGFNATLTSYRGDVASDFSLGAKPVRAQRSQRAARAVKSAASGETKAAAAEAGSETHRLAGSFGKGSPQITLDSFEGEVKLTRAPRNSIVSCK